MDSMLPWVNDGNFDRHDWASLPHTASFILSHSSPTTSSDCVKHEVATMRTELFSSLVIRKKLEHMAWYGMAWHGMVWYGISLNI